MKLVIAATGASGSIYLQRLLAQIDCSAHEVHLIMSGPAREVAKQDGIDYRKDRGVDADAQPENQNRRRGEAPVFAHHAQRVAGVLREHGEVFASIVQRCSPKAEVVSSNLAGRAT